MMSKHWPEGYFVTKFPLIPRMSVEPLTSPTWSQDSFLLYPVSSLESPTLSKVGWVPSNQIMTCHSDKESFISCISHHAQLCIRNVNTWQPHATMLDLFQVIRSLLWRLMPLLLQLPIDQWTSVALYIKDNTFFSLSRVNSKRLRLTNIQ